MVNDSTFSLTDDLPPQAQFSGNCSKAAQAMTINLEYAWHKMNGNQMIERKLKMTFQTKGGSQNASLLSATFIHELKENMTEYIMGKTNSTQLGSRFPLTVNLVTKYEYSKPRRTTALSNAILTIEKVDLTYAGGRGGRNLDQPRENMDNAGHNVNKTNQRISNRNNTKAKNAGNKTNAVLIHIFILTICFFL